MYGSAVCGGVNRRRGSTRYPAWRGPRERGTTGIARRARVVGSRPGHGYRR
jgi:hypothetical protein